MPTYSLTHSNDANFKRRLADMKQRLIMRKLLRETVSPDAQSIDVYSGPVDHARQTFYRRLVRANSTHDFLDYKYLVLALVYTYFDAPIDVYTYRPTLSRKG